MEENYMLIFWGKNQIEAVKRTNDYTEKFGLRLSDQDIQELVIRRRECLSEQKRVEFGNGILEKLIFEFCDSDYIYQGNYAEMIASLQEIFYLYKNESMDELTDDELLTFMRESFDGECQGSLEFLEETVLERFARSIRANTHKFIGRYEEDE